MDELDDLDSIIDSIDEKSSPSAKPSKASGSLATENADLEDVLASLDNPKPAAVVASSSRDPRVSTLDFGLGDLDAKPAPVAAGGSKVSDPRISSLDFGLGDIKSTSTTTTTTVKVKPALPSKTGAGNVGNYRSAVVANDAANELDDILGDLNSIDSKKPKPAAAAAAAAAPAAAAASSSKPQASPRGSTSGRVCAKCNQTIGPGPITNVDDKFYHQTCFVCDQCGLVVKGNFLIMEGRTLCGACSSQHSCAKCGKQIEGAYMEMSGKKMHKNCADVQQCGVCHKELLGEIVTAAGVSYHGSCFKCADCGASLRSYVQDGSRFKCTSCGEKNAPRCSVCGNTISGEYLTMAGERMHNSCFKCARCGVVLGTSPYFELDGRPHCASCGKQ